MKALNENLQKFTKVTSKAKQQKDQCKKRTTEKKMAQRNKTQNDNFFLCFRPKKEINQS